jgi:hypothetical protein
MPLEEMKCPNCGGSIVIDPSNKFSKCNYCGTVLRFTANSSGNSLEAIEVHIELLAKETAIKRLKEEIKILLKKLEDIKESESRLGDSHRSKRTEIEREIDNEVFLATAKEREKTKREREEIEKRIKKEEEKILEAEKRGSVFNGKVFTEWLIPLIKIGLFLTFIIGVAGVGEYMWNHSRGRAAEYADLFAGIEMILGVVAIVAIRWVVVIIIDENREKQIEGSKRKLENLKRKLENLKRKLEDAENLANRKIRGEYIGSIEALEKEIAEQQATLSRERKKVEEELLLLEKRVKDLEKESLSLSIQEAKTNQSIVEPTEAEIQTEQGVFKNLIEEANRAREDDVMEIELLDGTKRMMTRKERKEMGLSF